MHLRPQLRTFHTLVPELYMFVSRCAECDLKKEQAKVLAMARWAVS
jgi:hypothetical protein